MKCVNLLCCLNPIEEVNKITELTFYTLINHVVPVKNIKLICNYGQAKAFVQVENQLAADFVIREINGKSYGQGTIKIFLSNKRYVAFDQPLEKVLEDAHCKEYKLEITNINVVSSSNRGDMCDNSSPNINEESYDSECNEDLHIFAQEDFSQKIDPKRDISLKLNNKPRAQLESNYLKINYQGKFSADSWATKSSLNTLKLQTPTEKNKLRIIQIDNVNLDKVSCQMILNVFSNFGNILKLWSIQALHKVFLEYESHKNARRAARATNNMKIFDLEMRLSLSNEWVTKLFIKHQSSEEIKFVKGTFKFYRYKDMAKKPIKNLSTKLHFTNVSSSITPESLCLMISEIHKPVRIVQGLFKYASKESFIIEFSSLTESVEVLSLFHNRKLDGRKFFVEFIDIDFDSC